MTVAPSLFDGAGTPVLSAASEWVTGTLFGSLAISLCVIAVAFIGFMMMTGRIALREGVRVAIGCFVLLGAPVVAAGLQGLVEETSRIQVPQEPAVVATPAPSPLPPSTYDPYAGASLRTD